MTFQSRIFCGTVVHKRLRPKPHALSYKVFSLLLDVDEIDRIATQLTTFSRNRFNLISFHDRDHGAGTATPVGAAVRETLAQAGLAAAGHRVLPLCYPRILGYVFNPLSVYYGFGQTGELEAIVYEVNNTFGERRSYVVSAGQAAGRVHAQGCSKELYVSPFTSPAGQYGFRVTVPRDDLLIAVNLRDANGPLLKTHFRANARPLTDGALLALSLRYPFQTVKVMAAIHWEALKLWIKGIPLTTRRPSPRYAVTNVDVRRSD